MPDGIKKPEMDMETATRNFIRDLPNHTPIENMDRILINFEYLGFFSISRLATNAEVLAAYFEMVDVIENQYFEAVKESTGSLSDKHLLRAWKLRIAKLKANGKEAERKIEKRNKEARDKREKEKLLKTPQQTSVTDMLKAFKTLKQFEDAQQPKKKVKLLVLKNPEPKNFEEALENLEPMKETDPENYRIGKALLEKKYFEGKEGSAASKELISEFMMPGNKYIPENNYKENKFLNGVFEPSEYIKEDGTQMDILEFMAAQDATRPPQEPLYWCKTLEEHEYDVHMERLENDPVYAEEHFQRKQAEAKQNAEDQRVKNLEWEREQTIKRKAEKLISDMKTREQVKCLIPKKSDAPSVEELSGNIES